MSSPHQNRKASGRLKDVDYISGVSGGTYAATAFASHLVALRAPDSGEPVDCWYRRAVAKMTPGKNPGKSWENGGN